MTLRLLATTCLLLQSAGAAVTVYGPVHYRGRLDSPFFGGMATGDIIVEDVEDRLVNTPGLRIVGNFSVRRYGGVDEEDGRLDGAAVGGNWISGPTAREAPIQFDLRFDRGPDGRFPLYAGLALVGFEFPQLPDSFALFSAWDGNGEPVSPSPYRIDEVRVTSISGGWSTFNDQFFGIYTEAGISRIVIQRRWLIDHIQYGWAIPEPGSAALLLAAGGLALRRRRHG